MKFKISHQVSIRGQKIGIRKQIALIVEQIEPLDEKERKHKYLVLEWINSGAELFRLKKPATPKTHLVSYFIPIDQVNGKILLGHHKKANLWLPPGGHVDKDEHPQKTVLREMKEELFTEATFISNQPIFLTVTKTVNDMNTHTDVSLWYLVEGDSKADYLFDEREFYQVEWFSMEELPEKQMEPHLPRFLNKLAQFASKKLN